MPFKLYDRGPKIKTKEYNPNTGKYQWVRRHEEPIDLPRPASVHRVENVGVDHHHPSPTRRRGSTPAGAPAPTPKVKAESIKAKKKSAESLRADKKSAESLRAKKQSDESLRAKQKAAKLLRLRAELDDMLKAPKKSVESIKAKEKQVEVKKEEVNDEGLTTEQERKLMELKGPNDKSWREIAGAMGMLPGEIGKLKTRYKELKALGAGEGVKKEEPKKAEVKKEGPKKVDVKEGPKKENVKNEEPKMAGVKKEDSVSSGRKNGHGNVDKKTDHGNVDKKTDHKNVGKKKGTGDGNNRATSNHGGSNHEHGAYCTCCPAHPGPRNRGPGVYRKVVEPDDLFDHQDLDQFWDLMMEDEENKWLRMSSRFHDRTGRWIAAEDIKLKFSDGMMFLDKK